MQVVTASKRARHSLFGWRKIIDHQSIHGMGCVCVCAFMCAKLTGWRKIERFMETFYFRIITECRTTRNENTVDEIARAEKKNCCHGASA